METSGEVPAKRQRPWTKNYPKHVSSEPFAGCLSDGLSMFRHAVAAAYDRPAIHYFDRTLSYGELDRLSDAFAGILLANGVIDGDRVALYLQNVPQFVICLLGTWKMGAIGVSINPMNRSRELTLLLQDSDARVLVLHRDLYKDVAEPVLTNFPHVVAITTSARDYQGRHDSRVMNEHEPKECPGTIDLAQALQTGSSPTGLRTELASDRPAMIVYTSGTTGIPKGAVITHANFAFDAVLWREWMEMRNGGPILAIAPLFHITGLVGHIGAAIATCSPIILSMRFHPEVVADAAQEYQAEFTVGAITAFIAIMNSPGVRPEQFKTLVKVYTGGAPVPTKVAEEFRKSLACLSGIRMA